MTMSGPPKLDLPETEEGLRAIKAEAARREDVSEDEAVNHPPHYNQVAGVECIEVIEGLGLSYHLGNALKYIWRSGHKGRKIEDLKKARWYLDRAIEKAER